MDHPLIGSSNRDIRQRVARLFAAGFSVRRNGSIVFVCGGNEDNQMRKRFQAHCSTNFPDIEIFFPEFAMRNYFSEETYAQFDIAEFEELVAELSHAIVLFPEAAGSFAETGYFCLTPKLCSKTILALDTKWQGNDSFISLGPALRFDRASVFRPIVQLSYVSPNFETITSRITRNKIQKTRKTLEILNFKSQSSYELMCISYKLFDIMVIANIRDIIFMMKSLFKGRIIEEKIKRIISIMVGAGYIREIGEYGHYTIIGSPRDFLITRDGYREEETTARMELAAVYARSDPEFINIVDEARDAD